MENFDILVCGSSDPGSAALLSPWSTIEGFHFDSTPEVDEFMYEFREDLNNQDWKKNEDAQYDQIRIDAETKERYFETLNKMSEINRMIKTFCTTDDESNVIIEDDEDIDASEEEKVAIEAANNDEKDQS